MAKIRDVKGPPFDSREIWRNLSFSCCKMTIYFQKSVTIRPNTDFFIAKIAKIMIQVWHFLVKIAPVLVRAQLGAEAVRRAFVLRVNVGRFSLSILQFEAEENVGLLLKLDKPFGNRSRLCRR